MKATTGVSESMRKAIEQLREFDTALVANTIGYVCDEPPDQWYMGSTIRSVTPSLGPTAGVAMTCTIDSSTPGNAPNMDAFWAQLERMVEYEAPIVWVVRAEGSRQDHECVIGDGMAKLLYASGCVGLVTNGGVRDIAGILSTGLATYCAGSVIHHTPLRFWFCDQPVEVGGIRINSGDVIHANAEGVIRVPASVVERLPDPLIRMRSMEHDIHRVWRQPNVSIQEKRRYCQTMLEDYAFESNNKEREKTACTRTEESPFVR